MSLSFKIALAADCIAVLIAFYFIFSDAIRGSSSNNGPLTSISILFCFWIAGSVWLYKQGYTTIASSMLWLPAIPLLGYGLMILMFIILKPDMK